jgi:hypothetical protein
VHDWEVKAVSRFFGLFYSQKVRYGGDDTICWIPSKRKSFEVKSYNQVLSTPVWYTFSWKSIWKVKVLLKVAFFVWMETLGKMLTKDNLRKMNIIIIEWCCMCKTCGVSIDHLILHCEVATEMWSMLL